MKLTNDDVFIYPTDTVWGIGASVYSETGHAKIAEIKRTAKNKPLSVMFASAREVYDSFNFPEEVTLEWLEVFFTLETTLGFPLSLSKIKIPKWATGESEYVSIRCLENATIKKIHDEIKAPFFSTSLNLTGESPITTTTEAKKFHETHAKEVTFISGESTNDLSGKSSTMVFLNENLNFEIKREGRRVEEVKNHLMKLFC
jgi:L-threonylcarbamoyladenylate synthase